jgi:hypothetical protein
MWKPAKQSSVRTLKQAVLAAFAIAILPAAAAFASHFKIEHPIVSTPTAEGVLFCSPCISEIDDFNYTPTSEEYLLDEMMR